MNRRHFLQTSSLGFGWLGLSALASGAAAKSPKRVIFLCMRGAPSHVDTFDYKPKLNADGFAITIEAGEAVQVYEEVRQGLGIRPRP